MKPFGNTPIWVEQFEELMLRWFHRQSDEVKEQAGSAAAASNRVKRRVATVQKYAQMPPATRQISSPREFQARWVAQDAWELMNNHSDRLGFHAIRERSPGTMHDLSQTVLGVSEREQILIVDQALAQQIELMVANGCTLPLKTNDLAPLALAREVYIVLVERMGRPPQQWIDDLAQHFFAKSVVGFPINLMILELLDQDAIASDS